MPRKEKLLRLGGLLGESEAEAQRKGVSRTVIKDSDSWSTVQQP